MTKSYGDALSYDIATGYITVLTHYPNAGYLRAQYLPNGDVCLIGAREFVDFAETRETSMEMEMWILKPGSFEPVPLNHKIFEGVAISAQSNRIAWANIHDQYPEIAEGLSIICAADIVYNNGTPSLANKKEVFRASQPECVVEPHDFFNNDTELTYSCYAITEDS